MLRAATFIEPCLPSPADKPPSGANWIHEIKHDGYRLMARRDPVGIRLLTRNGSDWSARFPLRGRTFVILFQFLFDMGGSFYIPVIEDEV